MNINFSYDQEFDDIMMYLKSKYANELFDYDGIGKQIDLYLFSKKFFSTKTVTADASMDANANVDSLDVIAYSVELKKPFERLNSYYMLWKELKRLYGLLVANRIMELQLTGTIYINDFHGIGAGMPYCFNYSTYDIMLQGLPMVKKIKSEPPKHLLAFKSQLEQFVTLASNSTLGATGLADMLIILSFYVEKIMKTGSDAHFDLIGAELAMTFSIIQRETYWVKMSRMIEELGKKLTKEQQNKLEINGLTSETFWNSLTVEQQDWIDKRRKVIIEDLVITFDDNQVFLYKKNIYRYVKENLASFIYTINQPMRGNQSPFTNISIYDKFFLESLCGDYTHPETGEHPKIELVQKVQEIFLDVMNSELERTPITFPITTACFSIDEENNIKDQDFKKFIARKNIQFGFINIYCGKTSTLSSCCRLRSDIENEYFNSFGSGSSKIGSLGVCTINLPRIAYKHILDDNILDGFIADLEELTEVCAKVNNAKRKIVQKRITNGNHPLYDYGFATIEKQYSTVGINGFYEAIETIGHDILTPEGQEVGLTIINTINKVNKRMETYYKAPHNCEQIPAENVSIKLADKDRLLGYQTTYTIYSNQFIPLVLNADMLDRIKLQGFFDKHFTGGAICHLNVEQRIDNPEKLENLIELCAKQGVIYWAVNYNLQLCENGHMTVGRGEVCSVCGGKIIDNFTRVVGFLTSPRNWHKVRREVDYPNRTFYKGV